jgi:PAS domain S-box-containing protein
VACGECSDWHHKSGQKTACTAPLNAAILETGGRVQVFLVTRELQIERKLSRVEATPERLASLLTLSYEPMFAWQLNGPIEFWNTGAERLYGFTPEEAIGHSSHALLQTKFPVEFNEFIAQLQNERLWAGELRHICKDGLEV